MNAVKRISSPPQQGDHRMEMKSIERGGGSKRWRRKRGIAIAFVSLLIAAVLMLQGRVIMVVMMRSSSSNSTRNTNIASFRSVQHEMKQEFLRHRSNHNYNHNHSTATASQISAASPPVTEQTKQRHYQQLPIQLLISPPSPHPHAGARDEFGQWGYVHDPTFVKRHPLPFTNDLGDGKVSICETRFGLGEEGFDGYEGLQRIYLSESAAATTAQSQAPRILCIVYTHSNRHSTLVQAIVETYATHCDGFMAASNQTNRTVGAVDLPHKGPESYAEMWNKVRSIWSYVHDHYLNDFDYFHLNGDDTYVIAENLRQYVATLATQSHNEFQYLGGIMADYKPRRTYCGGGGGYSLNRATLQLLVKTIMPSCGSNFTSPQEDFIVGICFLRHNRTLRCGDTRDDQGATRYHQATAEWQVQWRGGKANVMRNDMLMERHNFQYKSQLEGISPSSISFHLKDPNVLTIERTMRRYHAILYPKMCSKSKSY